MLIGRDKIWSLEQLAVCKVTRPLFPWIEGCGSRDYMYHDLVFVRGQPPLCKKKHEKVFEEAGNETRINPLHYICLHCKLILSFAHSEGLS